MSQWLAENHQRRFPFALDTTLPFGDDVLVDFMTVLSTEFQLFENGGHIELDGVIRLGTVVTFYFLIESTALPGYFLEAEFDTTDEEDTRVIMRVMDPTLLPRPDLGYGICFIGNPAALTGFISIGTGLAKPLDSTVIRLSDAGHQTTIRVANKNRQGPSTCDETEGDPSSILLQNRVAATVTGCVEVTTAPTLTQESVQPTVQGNVTVPVPVPNPLVEYTRYPNTTVTTITTHAVTIEDEIPALPLTYDAEVDGAGPLVAAPLIEAGNNIKLSGTAAINLMRLSYQLGAGLGVNCADVAGYPDLGRLAKDCVKAINGAHTRDGKFELVAGDGISLIPDPAGHRILVLVNAEDLQRAAP